MLKYIQKEKEMASNVELIMKFPVVFRKKLLNNEINFPPNTEFEFEDFEAYRCVVRKKNDNSLVTQDDFKSNAEKQRTNIRGEDNQNLEFNPKYYGTSLYTNRQALINRLHLPKKKNKIAKGKIYQDGGPILRDANTHVCWWLYENVDVGNFTIEDCEV